jgi:hypothetical protein
VQLIPKLVAEGQLKIARHFHGGRQMLELNTVAVGTAEMDSKNLTGGFGRMAAFKGKFVAN